MNDHISIEDVGGEIAFNSQNTRSDLLTASHAQGNIYSSEAVYQRELDTYFTQDWLFIGREEQFANPGDYEARRILGRPIIIARDKHGKLGAFYNMCRHRGVEVVEGSGNARAFSCPYHGWTYDLSGKLIGAAHMRESVGFEASTCRLPSIHLENWRGNLFICFAERPRPFEDAMADLETDFGLLQTERCRLASMTSFQLDCNWKLFHENLMDFYHAGVLHAKTIGRSFSWHDENFVLRSRGGFSVRHDAAPAAPDRDAMLAPIPWLEEASEKFAMSGYLAPNFTIFARIDCVQVMQAWPLGAGACEIRIYILMPEESLADPDFERKIARYVDYQNEILGEDRAMIHSMQKNVALPVYDPGRFSIMERPIHHALNSYLERMFGSEAEPA